MSSPRDVLDALIAAHTDSRARAALEQACAEVAAGVSMTRFCSLFSMQSRSAGRGLLQPTDAERAAAQAALPGWEAELWTKLEAARVRLILARTDLAEESGRKAIDELFRFADQGELCALYRALAFLPGGERFAWQAAEGCRTNMLDVFTAVACDTPYPREHFDAVAWRQMVIKALFVGAPAWRIVGLDERLDEELARMALDLVEERRSAGREIQHELWLCLGKFGGDRALAALESELASQNIRGRRAAAYGLARAGAEKRLAELAETEPAGPVADAMRDALAGNSARTAFRALDPRLEN
ncbi:MAG: EboA domain-containing protein [Planctomycetes bacterium]|nr:EboA domain-containing protein [Planctomycetota bacterium]MCB9906073.1 EboA domain-containing protein [Planctomycetota bacterium]